MSVVLLQLTQLYAGATSGIDKSRRLLRAANKAQVLGPHLFMLYVVHVGDMIKSCSLESCV